MLRVAGRLNASAGERLQALQTVARSQPGERPRFFHQQRTRRASLYGEPWHVSGLYSVR
jgi:hypothetical protein